LGGGARSPPQTLLIKMHEAEFSRFLTTMTPGNLWQLTPLRTLLMKYGLLGCGDPRDRIYSLKSLSSDIEDFPVDYQLEPLELFLKALAACSGESCFCISSHLLKVLQIDIPGITAHNEPGIQAGHEDHQDQPFIEFQLSSRAIITPNKITDWDYAVDTEDYEKMPYSWRTRNGKLYCVSLSNLYGYTYMRFAHIGSAQQWRCVALALPDVRDHKSDYTRQINFEKDAIGITLSPVRTTWNQKGFHLVFTRSGLLGFLSLVPSHNICDRESLDPYRFC